MPAGTRQTVALDVMGADCGSESIILGGIAAARKMGKSIHVVFVGDKTRIEGILRRVDNMPDNVSTQHAPTEVPMGIAATEGVRMRDSGRLGWTWSSAIRQRLSCRRETLAH